MEVNPFIPLTMGTTTMNYSHEDRNHMYIVVWPDTKLLIYAETELRKCLHLFVIMSYNYMVIIILMVCGDDEILTEKKETMSHWRIFLLDVCQIHYCTRKRDKNMVSVRVVKCQVGKLTGTNIQWNKTGPSRFPALVLVQWTKVSLLSFCYMLLLFEILEANIYIYMTF